jgi:hypothetical protein
LKKKKKINTLFDGTSVLVTHMRARAMHGLKTKTHRATWKESNRNSSGEGWLNPDREGMHGRFMFPSLTVLAFSRKVRLVAISMANINFSIVCTMSHGHGIIHESSSTMEIVLKYRHCSSTCDFRAYIYIYRYLHSVAELSTGHAAPSLRRKTLNVV